MSKFSGVGIGQDGNLFCSFEVVNLKSLPLNGIVIVVKAFDQKIMARGRVPFTEKPTPLAKFSRPLGE